MEEPMAVDDAGASGSGTEAAARVDGLLAKAHALKAEGNALYKEGKWGEAIAKFFEVIGTVTAADHARNLAAASAMGLGSGDGSAKGAASDLTPEQQAQLHELTVSANLNMAAALIKRERWERVEEVCTKVLTLEPDNVKALLRRGSARLKQRNSDGAQADLQRVKQLEPGNVDADRELRALAVLQRQENTQSKAVFAKMFSA